MKARITSMCTHQLIRPAVVSSSKLNPSRNVIISAAMKHAMTIDSNETVAPSAAGRNNARRTSKNRMPPKTAVANGTRITR